MQIRKLFKVEMAHVVRNCSTDRCKKSTHGHKGTIEVFLTANKFDNAGMIMDFGLMKNAIKQFVDSLDHCLVLWSKDNPSYLKDMKKWNDRWVELRCNPSAECLALFFVKMINEILYRTSFCNGEGNVICSKVIYHETDTGYAEATYEDIKNFPLDCHAEYSDGVTCDWGQELKNFINDLNQDKVYGFYFKNPEIELQVID